MKKIVVLTGATRGLGLAMARRLMADGHTVAGCGRDPGRIAAMQREAGSPHTFEVVEVSDVRAVSAWAARVMDRLGPPDLLLNNAAVTVEPAPLWEIAEADFSRVVDVNIKGTANTIRVFLPAMIRAGRGVVVNFSSGWGRTTDARVAPYCATKWAVEGLTQALAQELPAGLAAVALNPGIIRTDMLQQCFGAGAADYPEPDEWAESAVPFLLSLGPQHNGQSLDVPGARLE